MKLSIISLLTGVVVASFSASALADEAPASPAAPAPVVAPASPTNQDVQLAPPSEKRTANNSIFLEGLGNGGLYSLNYERFIGDFGVRVGASYVSVSATDGAASGNITLMTFPVVASYYLGGANHKLQLGLGATILEASASGSSLGFAGSTSGVGAVATGVIGYRYMPKDGGFDFGVGFTPLVGQGGFAPFFGIHAGAVF